MTVLGEQPNGNIWILNKECELFCDSGNIKKFDFWKIHLRSRHKIR